jgi:hypothetical protein
VVIKSDSGGTTVNANFKDQAMQMTTDFAKVCPGIAVSILENTADYEVILNHVEKGLLNSSNQTTVAYNWRCHLPDQRWHHRQRRQKGLPYHSRRLRKTLD